MEHLSFKQLYLIEKAKRQPTPAALFVRQMARLTRSSEATVRQWLSGCQRPDALAQEKLSNYFNIPETILFPHEYDKDDD